VTQREVQARAVLPRPHPWLASWGEASTFRCQTYWLLATRAAGRVLWQTACAGRYEPSKTDRVTRVAGGQGWLDRVIGDRLGR
jgi:hypothetical protein